jgi:ASC-1-like (ASCH) protein
MRDPWFTLVVAGLKKMEVRFAEPRPPMAGRPAPAAPGFEDLKKGDVITWSNKDLGMPKFQRTCKVEVTGVIQTTTTDLQKALTATATRLTLVFPTVASWDEAKACLGALGNSEVEKKVVLFSFKKV